MSETKTPPPAGDGLAVENIVPLPPAPVQGEIKAPPVRVPASVFALPPPVEQSGLGALADWRKEHDEPAVERPETVDELPPSIDPEMFRAAGGFIRAFYDCGTRCAPYPNPPLVGVSALAACAGLAGQGFRTPGGVWPNLFVLGLGETGCGKDAPLRLIADLFARLDSPNALPPLVVDRYAGKPKSGAGFQDALFRHGVQVFGCDEVSDLLVGMNAHGASAAVSAELSSTLLAAFSDSTGFSRRRVIKKTQGDETPQRGWNLQATLVGWTQPALLWDSLTERDFDSGLIGRCLVVEASPRRANPLRNPPALASSGALVEAGRAILDAGGRKVYTDGQIPMPRLVDFEDDIARDFADEIRARFDADYSQAQEAEDRLGMAVAVRGFEKALKVALIFAVSENPHGARLTRRGLEWSERLVSGLTRRLAALSRRNLAGSADERLRNRILAKLRADGGEVSERDLCRAVRSASAREIGDALDGLVLRQQVERVEVVKSGKRGRPSGPGYRLLL